MTDLEAVHVVARIVNATPNNRVVAFDLHGNLVARSNRIETALVGVAGSPARRDLTFVGRADSPPGGRLTPRLVACLMQQCREAERLEAAGASTVEIANAQDRVARDHERELV